VTVQMVHHSAEAAGDRHGAETPTFTITQLAEEFGVTTRAIRFYEDKDLLHPLRQGQTRIYRPRDRARLQLIVRGKRVGFTLAEIREILDLYDLHDSGEAQYRHALVKFEERIDSLRQQKSEIDAQIDQLQDGLNRVEGLLRDAQSDGAPKSCAKN